MKNVSKQDELPKTQPKSPDEIRRDRVALAVAVVITLIIGRVTAPLGILWYPVLIGIFYIILRKINVKLW